jgi:hypothetical protein
MRQKRFSPPWFLNSMSIVTFNILYSRHYFCYICYAIIVILCISEHY